MSIEKEIEAFVEYWAKEYFISYGSTFEYWKSEIRAIISTEKCRGDDDDAYVLAHWKTWKARSELIENKA